MIVDEKHRHSSARDFLNVIWLSKKRRWIANHIRKQKSCWVWEYGDAYGTYHSHWPQSGGYFDYQGFSPGFYYSAAEISYLIWRGDFRCGQTVRRTCRTKNCINPEHLEIRRGTK